MTDERIAPNEIFPTDEAAPGQKRINNTTVRDWQQSNLGASMTADHMHMVAPDIDTYFANAGKYPGVAEVGGGTVPRMDILPEKDGGRNQSPFDHIRKMKQLMPHTAFMALVRSDAGGGMEEIPPDVLQQYIKLYRDAGVDVFRNFHALNDPRAHVRVAKAVHEAKAHYQAAYSYAVYNDDPTVYNPKAPVTFFIKLIKTLEAAAVKDGKDKNAYIPDSLVIKDPSGVLTPEMARIVTKEVKQAQKDGLLPKVAFGIHMHNQAGWAHESCKAALEAGANFVDAGPALEAGGYGAQPPALKLFDELAASDQGKSLGFSTGDAAGAAREALTKIDSKCAEMLAEMVPGKDGEPEYRYKKEIRQASPDPKVTEHGVAGGQSSGIRKELEHNNLLHRYDDLLAIIPKVRKEAGVPCQVTPVADYIDREARSRLIMNRNPDQNFPCGFQRLLTGEMGPTKELMDGKKARQALYERTVNKLEQFVKPLIYSKKSGVPMEPWQEKQLRDWKSAIPKLVNYMWDLSAPVRHRARLRELEERIGELRALTGDKGFGQDIAQSITALAQQRDSHPGDAQIAERLRQVESYTPEKLQKAIAALETQKNEMEHTAQMVLDRQLQSFASKNIDISGFAGKTDGEKYEAMYDALQRQGFKDAVKSKDDSNPLYALYRDIKHENTALFNSMLTGGRPELAIKLIRSAGLSTVCWGEIIPPALDKIKTHLLNLKAQGKYQFPEDERTRSEHEVIVGMLNDPRGGKQYGLPNDFLERQTMADRAQVNGVHTDQQRDRANGAQTAQGHG